jgi:flagellar biosynthesis protein FlhG
MDDIDSSPKIAPVEASLRNPHGAATGFQKSPNYTPQVTQSIQRAKQTAKKLKIPFVNPMTARIEPAAIALVNQDTAKQLLALPIRIVDNTLLVAMATPEKIAAVRTLEMLTSCKVRPAIAPKNLLTAALEKVYNYPQGPPTDLKPSDRGSKGLARGRDSQASSRPVKKAKSAKKTTGAKTHTKPTKRAQTISIISNKGGVGKTHLAINLAYALVQKGAQVLLIDTDLGNADISNKLGIFPESHLMDFLEKDRELKDLIVTTPFGFDLICGTYGEFKLANLNYAQKTRFIKHFKNISRGYDYALFDLGAGIARTVLDFALGADHTVIVTTPQDLISGYACVKAAFYRFKELEERLEKKLSDYAPHWVFSPMVVVNQVSHQEQGFKLFENLAKTTDENINPNEDRFRVALQYLGSIQYDKENVRSAETKKKPILLSAPYIKASQCIEHMTVMICKPDEDFDPRVRFGHSFKRFMAILSKKL